MKYKIHERYEAADFWSKPKAPSGYRRTRNCRNCGKMSVAASGPSGLTMVCNEVTEYTGIWDTGVPRGYSRQPFYGHESMTCDEHKFQHEMEGE